MSPTRAGIHLPPLLAVRFSTLCFFPQAFCGASVQLALFVLSRSKAGKEKSNWIDSCTVWRAQFYIEDTKAQT